MKKTMLAILIVVLFSSAAFASSFRLFASSGDWKGKNIGIGDIAIADFAIRQSKGSAWAGISREIGRYPNGETLVAKIFIVRNWSTSTIKWDLVRTNDRQNIYKIISGGTIGGDPPKGKIQLAIGVWPKKIAFYSPSSSEDMVCSVDLLMPITPLSKPYMVYVKAGKPNGVIDVTVENAGVY